MCAERVELPDVPAGSAAAIGCPGGRAGQRIFSAKPPAVVRQQVGRQAQLRLDSSRPRRRLGALRHRVDGPLPVRGGRRPVRRRRAAALSRRAQAGGHHRIPAPPASWAPATWALVVWRSSSMTHHAPAVAAERAIPPRRGRPSQVSARAAGDIRRGRCGQTASSSPLRQLYNFPAPPGGGSAVTTWIWPAMAS